MTESLKEKYWNRKNTNLCTACGKKPPRENRTRCDTCGKIGSLSATKKMMDNYYERLSRGLCGRCGINKIESPSKVSCTPCRLKSNNIQKRRNAQSKEAGFCVKCKTRRKVNACHCAVCRAAHNKRGNIRRKINRSLALEAYGNKCVCCGESQQEFLTIDHIFGAKNKIYSTAKKAYKLYAWLRLNKYPNTFRCLCINCNYARGVYGYCPHTKELPQLTHGL